MLSFPLAGSWSMQPDPEDGTYFIDRDGALFKHILQYLRDPMRFESPNNPETRSELAREAEYFGLKVNSDILLITIAAGF